jgi:hypothetical protein
MQKSSTVRKRLTPVQREKILSAYRRSGLPQRDFALQVGVSVSSLQLWLRKAAAGAGAPASFIPVPNLVASASPRAMYRLHLGGGMSLEIGSGFRSEELAALLALLPAVCSR